MTKAVKAFYEAYPYPTGLSEFDAEIAPARLLGELGSGPAQNGRWQVLEAGCGCGLGLIAAARRNPRIRFTGVDINQVGISQAQQQAAAEGLNNIRFMQTDLMTLEGLGIPEGDFNLIYSFGVLHHLSDPVIGLKNLARLLAPQGVIACMVYGRYGREPLQRLVDVIQLATAQSTPLEEQLQPARLLADIADSTLFRDTPWEQTSKVDDIEFVDRCLHVNEQSYDVDSLWQLLEQAGLRFRCWLKPAEWTVDELIEHAETRKLLSGLNNKDQYKVIERLFCRPRLELLMTHANDPVEPVP
ncbi:MAG: class I SAM-dependent methyltransferase [Pseudomonadota bacterium]